MGKNKKALKAEAMKKARQKKIIAAAACISITAVIAASVIFILLQSSGIRANADGVVDLTSLSFTMKAAEINRITTRPNIYLGKTIKLDGFYYTEYDSRLERSHHYVVIQQVDPCCPILGLEFICSGDRIYPDDYPAEWSEIEVAGVYGSYEEFGYPYFYLDIDDIVIK